MIPSEWLETNIDSTEFESESFGRFDEEGFRGKVNVCNRVGQCNRFDEEKERRDRELQSHVEVEEEEGHYRDIESKEQRRLKEESKETSISRK